jgi:uncharacterized protein (TIGR00369 family)
MALNTPTYGLAPLAEVTGQDGIDFLRGIIAGRYPMPPISQTLGFRLVEVDVGHAVFEGTPDERLLNPIATVHGGYIATLLDSAMACAVHSTLKAGQAYTTVEIKVEFIRPLTEETGLVRATGKLINAGRRLAVADGTLTDAKRRILAHGSTTCMIFPVEGKE